MSNQVFISVSIADLIDRISILTIKELNITDKSKHDNVVHELEVLKESLRINFSEDLLTKISKEMRDLHTINKKIWATKDELRKIEKIGGPFKNKFVKLARSIYTDNDERSRIKRIINTRLDSDIVEEKSY